MAKLEILPKRVDYLEVGNPASEFRINIDILNVSVKPWHIDHSLVFAYNGVLLRAIARNSAQ